MSDSFLRFNESNTNEFVSGISVNILQRTSWRIPFKIAIDPSMGYFSRVIILGKSGNNQSSITIQKGGSNNTTLTINVRTRGGGNSTDFTEDFDAAIVDGNPHDYVLTRDGDSRTCTIDGDSFGGVQTQSEVATTESNVIGHSGSQFSAQFDLYELAGYDAAIGGNRLFNFDPSLSAGTGLILVDTEDSSNNGDLENFSNDDSQWFGGGGTTDTIYSLDITSSYLQRLANTLNVGSNYQQRLVNTLSIASNYKQRLISALDINTSYKQRLSRSLNIQSSYQQRQTNTLNISSSYTQRLIATLSINSVYLQRLTASLDIISVYLTDSSDIIYSLDIISKYLARSVGALNIETEYKARLIQDLNIASSYKQRVVSDLLIDSSYLQRAESNLNIISSYQQRLIGTLIITSRYEGEAVIIRKTPTYQVLISEASHNIYINEASHQITIKG